MPNRLQDLMDTMILPQALPVLRESCVMPALVHRDFDVQAKEQNEKIRIPLPQDLGEAEDMDTIGGSKSTDLSDPKVDIILDKWKYKQFQMNDKEMFDSITKGVLPSAAESAIKALANAIDKELLNLHIDIPYFYGIAGTTPANKSDIIGVRKILQKNLCPGDSRRLVMDVEAEAEMLELFSDAEKNGAAVSTQALREAVLGWLYKFDTFADQLVPSYTAGTLQAQTPLVNGAVMTGATVVSIDGGTGAETITRGDRFTVAGVKGQFVFTSNATAASGAIASATFYPAAPVGGFPDNAAITIIGNHTPNMAFNKNAFALAMRPLNNGEASEASTISVAVDPVSGIPLRLETWREPGKSTRYWRFDVLFGVKTLRPELAAVLLG